MELVADSDGHAAPRLNDVPYTPEAARASRAADARDRRRPAGSRRARPAQGCSALMTRTQLRQRCRASSIRGMRQPASSRMPEACWILVAQQASHGLGNRCVEPVKECPMEQYDYGEAPDPSDARARPTSSNTATTVSSSRRTASPLRRSSTPGCSSASGVCRSASMRCAIVSSRQRPRPRAERGMRLVFDIHVLVSGLLFPGGPPSRTVCGGSGARPHSPPSASVLGWRRSMAHFSRAALR